MCYCFTLYRPTSLHSVSFIKQYCMVFVLNRQFFLFFFKAYLCFVRVNLPRLVNVLFLGTGYKYAYLLITLLHDATKYNCTCNCNHGTCRELELSLSQLHLQYHSRACIRQHSVFRIFTPAGFVARAPCGLQGWRNRPDTFSAHMS